MLRKLRSSTTLKLRYWATAWEISVVLLTSIRYSFETSWQQEIETSSFRYSEVTS